MIIKLSFPCSENSAQIFDLINHIFIKIAYIQNGFSSINAYSANSFQEHESLSPPLMCIYILTGSVCVYGLQTQPEEFELNSISPNMMKIAIVLLAAAATLASRVPQLESIIKSAQCLHTRTLKMDLFESVFVKDLQKNKSDRCEAEFFCQAQKVLSEVKFHKVLSAAWRNLTEIHCSVDKLLRNLKSHSNLINCTVPENGNEIILHSFLDDLITCAKKVLSSTPSTQPPVKRHILHKMGHRSPGKN